VGPFSAGDSVSSRELVIQDVIRGLYEGRYRPGQRLVEAKLTAAYGVSRGPVREALNRLAAMGVVSLALQRGAQVRELTLKAAIDMLSVVQGLLSLAARQAAERGDRAAGGRALEVLLERLSTEAGHQPADQAIARDEFYAALAELAGNEELNRVFLGVQIHLVRVQFGGPTQAIDHHRLADYRRIVSAVVDGDPARAEAAMRRHFARSIALLKGLQA
jgi:DNA-binding GntR family transcriptional regulator